MKGLLLLCLILAGQAFADDQTKLNVNIDEADLYVKFIELDSPYKLEYRFKKSKCLDELLSINERGNTLDISTSSFFAFKGCTAKIDLLVNKGMDLNLVVGSGQITFKSFRDYISDIKSLNVNVSVGEVKSIITEVKTKRSFVSARGSYSSTNDYGPKISVKLSAGQVILK